MLTQAQAKVLQEFQGDVVTRLMLALFEGRRVDAEQVQREVRQDWLVAGRAVPASMGPREGGK